MQLIEQWWEECHSEHGNLYISDYGGPELWQAMNIAARVRRWKHVLEIGIGDGNDVRRLHKKGCRVYGLDITPIALTKASKFLKACRLDPRELPTQRFDLVISHLVTQHMDDASLRKQITHVLRSLKRSGIFGMQFADWTDGTAIETYVQSLEFQQSGTVRRRPVMIYQLVAECGGKITWISEPKDFPEYNSRWFYVHIVPVDT